MSDKILRNCLNCSLLALGLLLLQVVDAQTSFSALDEELAARQKALPKDYTIQLWKQNDTLVYLKASGELNPKVTVSLGGGSSWLTAAMVMILVDEGKISLEDKITTWLPEFEKYGKNYITIRHCLTHTTGIKGDGAPVGNLFKKKKFNTLEEEVNSFAAKEIQSNPGTEFRFSDIGPAIAARVLEVVTKKRFDQLIKQKLFSVLKMRRTSFSNITGGPVSPADGASATPNDFMNFLVMLMNKGTYDGKRVLSEASVNEMLRMQVDPAIMKDVPETTKGFRYALGSWIADTGSTATLFAAPSFDGSWAFVDTCRGYAFLFMVSESVKKEKEKLGVGLKSAADKAFSQSCPG